MKNVIAATFLLTVGSFASAADLPVKYVDLNDIRISYVEKGQGEPLVLVHGAMSDYRTWERQLEKLSQNYRVISYTQRYFGTEPWNKEWPQFGVGTHANDLAAFIQKLGIAPANIAGWSYGAAVGLVVAQQHPKLVKGAYLFEPPYATWITDEGDRKAYAESRAFTANVGKAIKAGDNVGAASAMLDGVEGVSGVMQSLSPDLQTVVKDNARTLAVEQQPAPNIKCEDLAQLDAGVAIVRGEKSEPMFRIAADTASKCLKNARHMIVAGATHLWPGNDPAKFSESVVSTLSGK